MAVAAAFAIVACGGGADDGDGGDGGGAGGAGGSGGGGGGAGCEPLPDSICGQPCDVGNEKGVGKFCSSLDDCAGTDATLCAILGDPNAHFCTIFCSAGDGEEVCGTGAICECGDGGCGCTPSACVDGGGGAGG